MACKRINFNRFDKKLAMLPLSNLGQLAIQDGSYSFASPDCSGFALHGNNNKFSRTRMQVKYKRLVVIGLFVSIQLSPLGIRLSGDLFPSNSPTGMIRSEGHAMNGLNDAYVESGSRRRGTASYGLLQKSRKGSGSQSRSPWEGQSSSLGPTAPGESSS